MDLLLKKIFLIFLKIVPERLKDYFINITIKFLKNTDILTYAYNNIGILNWESEAISGEKFVIEKILKRKFNNKKHIISFDIGANIGRYCQLLNDSFPESEIYAFEPNPYTFEILKKNTQSKNIKIFNFGFGTNNIKSKIYTYKDDLISGHASIYEKFKDVINKDTAIKEVLAIDIEIKTLDSFCFEYGLTYLDFVKIDAEGSEFNIIKGATKLIERNRIGIIQFEFNVTNILSRTFLKDFYDTLSLNYNFYRIDTCRLISLGRYNSDNEIFKYQNILVVNKDIDK